jgi:hypothetical protein
VEDELRFPRTLSFNADYWLCRCEGFKVERAGTTLGVVEEVHYRSRPDRPDVLVVRGGRLGTRSFEIAVDEIEKLLPRQGRVLLRPAPGRQEEPEPLLKALRTRLAHSRIAH